MAVRTLAVEEQKPLFMILADGCDTTGITTNADYDWYIPVRNRALQRAILEVRTTGSTKPSGSSTSKLALRGCLDAGASPTRYFEMPSYQGQGVVTPITAGQMTLDWLLDTVSPNADAATGTLIQCRQSPCDATAQPIQEPWRWIQLWLRWNGSSGGTPTAGDILFRRFALHLYFAEV